MRPSSAEQPLGIGCSVSAVVRYQRREPEKTLLHRIVREHLATFLVEAQDRYPSGELPCFIRAEFEHYLRCGLLCHGFARVRCSTCHDELLVAFSCKKRGFCPSCAGPRMADSAAHLWDHVFSAVPVRQWVLPMQLRFLLAWRPKLIGLTLTSFLRALFAWQRRSARRQGIPTPLCGAVTCIQRFGSALNLNLHFHTLVPDGVFFEDSEGNVQFHPLPLPTVPDLKKLAQRLIPRLLNKLAAESEQSEDADWMHPAHAVLASPIWKSYTDDGRTSRLAYLRRRIFAPRGNLCLRVGRRRARTTRSLLRSSAAFTAPNRRGPTRPDCFSSEARSSRRTQAAAPVTDAVSRSNRRSDTTAPLSSGSLPRSVCAAQQTPSPDRSQPFEAPITNARRPIRHHLSTHAAAFPFPNRLGVAFAPSFRDRCASLRSLRRSPPAPVDDHRGQDRRENSQPPWHASPNPLPIPRPSTPNNPRFSRLERSSRGRSNPIELVALARPPTPPTSPASPTSLQPSACPSIHHRHKHLLFSPRIGDSLVAECPLPSPIAPVQKMTSLTMAPEPRLNFLSAGWLLRTLLDSKAQDPNERPTAQNSSEAPLPDKGGGHSPETRTGHTVELGERVPRR